MKWCCSSTTAPSTTQVTLQLPFIDEVLKQPFYTTELMSRIVRECEETMEVVFASDNSGDRWTRKCCTDTDILRNTVGNRARHFKEHRRGAGGHEGAPQRELHVRALLAATLGKADGAWPAAIHPSCRSRSI